PLRVARDTGSRPGAQRSFERIRERVLGEREVARRRREDGEQAPVRGAGDLRHPHLDVRPVARHDPGKVHSVQAPSTKRVAVGRISTAPYAAGGACSAHAIAASRSGTSMMTVPPSCSLVSANGPSWTRNSPVARLIVVVSVLGASTSAATST